MKLPSGQLIREATVARENILRLLSTVSISFSELHNTLSKSQDKQSDSALLSRSPSFNLNRAGAADQWHSRQLLFYSQKSVIVKTQMSHSNWIM
jgi:hypothetical protein